MIKRSAKNLDTLGAQLDKERRTVSFDTYDMNVRQLLDLVEGGAIDIAPEYQRKFVWDPQRESAYIESVFLSIPSPSLYMATNKDSTWEVVDGVQRLSTLIHFCGGESLLQLIEKKDSLAIDGLEKLDSFNGYSFSDLPKSIQLAFHLRSVRITTLNDKSDLQVRFDLFERLNTGGVRLQPQEIRNCVYRGPFADYLKDCSANPSFRKVVKVKAGSENNGTWEDLALRFFAFYERYQSFEHSVDGFLNQYMEIANSSMPNKAVKKLFLSVFKFLEEELPNGIVRGNRHSITPANLYEAIAVGTALALSEGENITRGVLQDLLNDSVLKSYTTGGTNSRPMVVNRIHYVRDKLVGK